jgi:hypothetical protein
MRGLTFRVLTVDEWLIDWHSSRIQKKRNGDCTTVPIANCIRTMWKFIQYCI